MKPYNTKKPKGVFVVLVIVSLLIITINTIYAAKPDANNPFDSVWAAIDVIRADITSIKTNISSIQADAAVNKSDIATIKSDIESIEARVEAIAPAATTPSVQSSAIMNASVNINQGEKYQIIAKVKNANGQPIAGLNISNFTLTGTVPASRLFPFGAGIDNISEDNGVYTIDVVFLAAGQYMLNLKANGVQIPGTVTAEVNADNEPAVKLCSYTQVPDVVPDFDMLNASKPYSFDIKFHMVNAASIPPDNLDLTKFSMMMLSSSAVQGEGAIGTQVENLGNGDYIYHCIAPNLGSNEPNEKETVLAVIWQYTPIGQGWEKIIVSRYVYGH